MNKRPIVVDCGRKESTMLVKGKISHHSHANLFNEILKLPRGSRVVCEEAHLGTARLSTSLSQPFTADELIKFYNACAKKGIELRWFPQQSTYNAQVYYRTKYKLTQKQFPKSDENDPKAIYEYLIDHVRTSLGKPKKSFEVDPVREEANELKALLNSELGEARSTDKPKYKYNQPNDQCRKFINQNAALFFDRLSPVAKRVFGFENWSGEKKEWESCIYKVGKAKGEPNINKVKIPQLYSVVTLLVKFDGSLRIRPSTGAVPGWKYAKRYLLSMSPFHWKGGVARSNLYHHGIKNYHKLQCKINGHPLPLKLDAEDPKTKSDGGIGVLNCAQRERLVKDRTDYCNAVREVFQLTRDILLNS